MLDGKTYLVQARPITNLPEVMITSTDIEAARREGIELVRQAARKLNRRVRWAIHNLDETLKNPTPLTWDIICRAMGGSGGFLQMYRNMGYFPSDRVSQQGVLDLICGHVYADLERQAELFYDQWPQEYDPEEADDANAMLEGPPTKFNFERSGGRFLLRLPIYIFKMLRQGRRMRKLSCNYLKTFEEDVTPRFLAYAKSARARTLSEMSQEQLLSEFDEREKAFNQIFRDAETTSSIAVYYQSSLQGLLEDLLGQSEGQALANRLVAGLEGNKTEEQNVALHAVAKGEMELETFLEEHGHRAAGEFELAEPRWYEDASYLQQQLASYRAAHGGRTLEPAAAHERSRADRAQAEKELTALLETHGASSLEEEIRADMAGAQKHMPYRETSKHYYMMAYALIRDVLQELARRWELDGDIYYLHKGELREFAANRGKFAELIAQRKIRRRATQFLEMPDFLDSEDPEAVGRPIELQISGDGILGGKGVAPGSDTGTARIVFSPKQAGEMGADYVLVCPSTDPGWTPLFVHARGVIVERGGMLSHGAIVARDFGIPCVVLANATKLIPDRTEIRIDGNRGVVELLDSAAAEEA
jgi:pyruvate,water dikinase